MAPRKSEDERVVRLLSTPPSPLPVPLPRPASRSPPSSTVPTMSTTSSTPTSSSPAPSALSSLPSSVTLPSSASGPALVSCPSPPSHSTPRLSSDVGEDTPATVMGDIYDPADLLDEPFFDPCTNGDFVMASKLVRKSKPEVNLSQTQAAVEVFIEGRAWRVFIKDLDQFRKVPRDGKTVFYCFAEPGGGFLMREFHDHLAKHNMGAFTPPAREGKFSEIGEERRPESFRSLVERFGEQDRREYAKHGEPMVQLDHIKTLGDVIFDLYSTGILSSGEVELYNEFRVKYKVEKVLHPTSSTVTAARQLFSNGTLATSERIVISESESEAEEVVDEDNTMDADKQEVCSIEREMAAEGLDASIEEDVASETVTKEKYQSLATKYNKSAQMLGRSFAVLHNQQKTIDSFQAKKSVISAKTISNCLKAYCGPKFASLEKIHANTQSMLGLIKSDALNAAARSGSLLAIERNKQKEAHAKKMLNPPPSISEMQRVQRQQALNAQQRPIQGYNHLPPNFAPLPQDFAQPGFNFPVQQQLFPQQLSNNFQQQLPNSYQQQQQLLNNFQQQLPVINNLNQANQIVGSPQNYQPANAPAIQAPQAK